MRSTIRTAAVLTALVAVGGAAPAHAALVGGGPATAQVAKAPAARAAAPTEIPDVAPAMLAGQPLVYDEGEYLNGPTVSGAQVCDPADEGAAKPTARQAWSYYDPQADTSGLSADLTITGWSHAKKALKDVVNDAGMCVRYDWEGFERVAWDGQKKQTAAAYQGENVAFAVVQDGPYLVSVAVYDWDGSGDELAAAQAEALAVAEGL